MICLFAKVNAMNRLTIVIALAINCMCNAACSTKAVKGTVRGIEITVQSQTRTKEYKPPGSGNGYGQVRPLASAAGNEFLVIALKAPKKIEFGENGIKASVKDDKGDAYRSVYSEVLGFDEKTEAK